MKQLETILKETRQTKHHYIDLRGMGLDRIPEEIAEFHFLQNSALSFFLI